MGTDMGTRSRRQPGAVAGRKPAVDYLRISITNRCDFRCRYCMPPSGVELKRHADIVTYEEIVRFTEAAVAAGITRVRVTGGEPLVRRQCPELIARLACLPGITDLALTTNGSRLARFAAGLKAAGLRRINISIDSLEPERFAAITGGGSLDAVLAGLERALELGFDPVKVNVVMQAGIEKDLEAFVALARELPVHVRFIEHMPVGRNFSGAWRYVSREELLVKLSGFGELTAAAAPVGAGPARYYRFAGHAGTLGFITSMSSHFCGVCNRLRLTADGKLRSCLFSDEEIDVRPLIAGPPSALAAAIRDVIGRKRFDRRPGRPGSRFMSQIGG